jgi:hypothetical protein
MLRPSKRLTISETKKTIAIFCSKINDHCSHILLNLQALKNSTDKIVTAAIQNGTKMAPESLLV